MNTAPPVPTLPNFTQPAWTRAFDLTCELGESPHWCGQTQALIWVDIAAQCILRGDVVNQVVERWPMPSTPGCVAPRAGRGFVVGLRSGVVVADVWGGELQPVWAYSPAASGLRLNDGKADAQGRFWVGSYSERREPTAMLVGLQPKAAQTGDWSVICERSGFAASNGLASSASGEHMYWADTAGHRVLRYPVNGFGDLGEGAPWLQLAPKPSQWDFAADPDHTQYAGRPDGATLDAEGAYWVALYEGSALLRIGSNGQVLERLRTPSLRPTMPCLGGADLKTLYLTTAKAPANSAEAAAQPDSGSVWSTRVSVPGVAAHRVASE